ncbi:phosphate/phosphite/phosphonate ABC transporter substrate-binding protein [Albidovulum sediminicola]|uniref:PhnD/SsuA/transferrin family substrate-binding protein n=1 Tax=Albidovulum sediminicola TaxID=2984331 RepID=A0ABT2Z2R7_9RHOB|nr:PhnD/SsuA/transferrin family substrate-binding protein [Defluviimonas sp. WL0075]MCV2865444.1 PhnD/SsuA/transferrin family substrate-binding protein [Defluviimonas sp. WL0075]
MIAMLPMYDWNEVRGATDRYWMLIRDGLRTRGIDAPEALTRDMDLWEAWESPDLLLGQTCGFPYRTRLHDRVVLVATPDYALPDAPAGYYYSQMVARAEETGALSDLLTRRLAINGTDSQSGWAAPLNFAASLGVEVGETVTTGAHLESARVVIEGRADIAAIDAVTWRLLSAHRPEMASALRVLGRTAPPTPGLPYITASGRDGAVIARAIAEAIEALSPADRAALGLTGLVALGKDAYMSVPVPQRK